ncbi:TetR/AcrR family transcriptional regulator [Roseibium sp. Sym1]|uniref:TetR/AcrR family transcriptional regulator n=1 Tax=Roseibium sp. Sym1 TaxID=3016006 RepID=UPI0022B51B14|nr:TetR/AcrR family transcriptional regulator [Roseibium sp. Sym1]
MPRMSEAEKRKSHNKILGAASRLLRANGTEATSVSDVMQAAGLTHGGFYRHFKSKDELVAAAFRTAVDEVLNDMEEASDDAARKKARRDYVDTYLSQGHVDNRAEGCPLAALANDLGRGEEDGRREGLAAVDRVSELLATRGGRAEGTALLALMVGTVTLARLAESDVMAEGIVKAGRTAAELLEREWPLDT